MKRKHRKREIEELIEMEGRWYRRVTVFAVCVVAGIAAVISYSHMQALALRAGEEWRSHLLPLAVDGLMVAASMTLIVRRMHGLRSGWLAWLSLIAGVLASLAANIAAAEPTWTARLLSCWPPLAFAAAFELLLQQRAVVRTAEDSSAVAENSDVTPPLSLVRKSNGHGVLSSAVRAALSAGHEDMEDVVSAVLKGHQDANPDSVRRTARRLIKERKGA
jgi:uncharacterized membrane protein YhaH (DUF805 family)